MGLLENIGTCIVSCGACPNSELCFKCRIETMIANGLPIKLSKQLIGVNRDGWNGVSPVSSLIKKLVKKHLYHENN